MLKNSNDPEDIDVSASICVRYSKKRNEKKAEVVIKTKKGEVTNKETEPMERETVDSLLIR